MLLYCGVVCCRFSVVIDFHSASLLFPSFPSRPLGTGIGSTIVENSIGSIIPGVGGSGSSAGAQVGNVIGSVTNLVPVPDIAGVST